MRTLMDLRNTDIENLKKAGINHVAVYGTLREGNGAHRMVEDLERVGDTMSLDGQVFGIYNTGPFPYIVDYDTIFGEGEDDMIRHVQAQGPVVELYKLPHDTYEQRIARLDMYEGYPALYNRDVVEITSPEQEVYRAVLYTWADVEAGIRPNHPMVPYADWNRARGIGPEPDWFVLDEMAEDEFNEDVREDR